MRRIWVLLLLVWFVYPMDDMEWGEFEDVVNNIEEVSGKYEQEGVSDAQKTLMVRYLVERCYHPFFLKGLPILYHRSPIPINTFARSRIIKSFEINRNYRNPKDKERDE